jgi:protein-tyrosine phosphatase
VVLHCQAGRDRTGIAVALLLSLAGVPDDAIAEDYALSAPYLLEHYEQVEDEVVRRELIGDMVGVAPETMLALLAHVRDAQGGAAAYLAAGGATADELDLLCRRLREA